MVVVVESPNKEIADYEMGKVDNEQLMEDIWYTVKNGAWVEYLCPPVSPGYRKNCCRSEKRYLCRQFGAAIIQALIVFTGLFPVCTQYKKAMFLYQNTAKKQ